MKTRLALFVLFISLIFSHNSHAQRFSYGVGVATHLGYFNVETEGLESHGYENPVTFSPAANFVVDYQGTEIFAFRMQPVLSTRQIRFTEFIEDVYNNNSNYLAINFLALDLGFSGRFKIPMEQWQITPFAGLNFSFNQHVGTSFQTLNSNAGSAYIIEALAQGNSFVAERFFIRPGILLGVGMGIGKNSKLELEGKMVYSPLDYMKGEKTIPVSQFVNIPLQGSFQYIAFGINFKFS